ncbi:MAG: D-alanine--D-alanine ligase [Candidatus Aminicenantes bacterium]|nr:D-alanine--D-alanine ligase [Candidatus Aminicenantes bacterium]
MMDKKRNIVILFGGRSAEHEVSIKSAEAVFDHLDPNQFTTQCIYFHKNGRWSLVDSPHIRKEQMEKGAFYSFLPWNSEKSMGLPKSSVYFPVLHGPYGEDGTIQGLLELADVPYVGATVMSSALGMDKAVAKSIFQSKGLPIVKHTVIHEKDFIPNKTKIKGQIKKEYSFPLFVKPSNLGSSIGITKVQSIDQLSRALDVAFRYDSKILVEQGIKGREIECSVLGNDHPISSLPGEVIPFRSFYDYQDKYREGKTKFGIPAQIPESVKEKIQEISIHAFQSIECSGMARIDFFYQEHNSKIYLNEINTIPGFTEISMYPKLWAISGIKFPSLIEKLVTLAVEKHADKKRTQDA